MVSLSAVEALAAELSPAVLSVVVSIPDLRKGEKLVLVTTDKDITRQRFQQLAKAKGAADLMVPAEVLVVDHVPVLGSGKTDYVATTALIKDKLGLKQVA
jgi:acyl-[acyl-carrier-protein]-phospholipid O-acyltransferase/long-chain-fatty-acid--[acyl-carrier-protein] ligase